MAKLRQTRRPRASTQAREQRATGFEGTKALEHLNFAALCGNLPQLARATSPAPPTAPKQNISSLQDPIERTAFLRQPGRPDPLRLFRNRYCDRGKRLYKQQN
jgi:hypothetical protein